jgi:TATA-box binding protein (TBP) (component of TFIID and TFIIIB)
MDIDAEWEHFMSGGDISTSSVNNESSRGDELAQSNDNKGNPTHIDAPTPSNIYISTKSKIAYLNKPVDLLSVFWKLNVILYTNQQNGIVKKQMKFNSSSQEEVDDIQKNLEDEYYFNEQILTSVTTPSGSKNWFKDVRKVTVGISKKDIISYRSKQKCAFYNCFVMILRILIEDEDDVEYGNFHEFHVKIFNTGKVEIPGIRSKYHLDVVQKNILNHLRPIIGDDMDYKGSCDTVLINSNFNCGFFINRENLFDILKTKYNIQCIYDPCSYPGIQCKFYYDKTKSIQNGVREYENIEKNKSIVVISFMIFRTGSILIVGMCEEDVLDEVYVIIKNMLIVEFPLIYQSIVQEEDIKPKNKKTSIRKRFITVDNHVVV